MADPILLFRPIFEETAEDITRQLINSREKIVDIWMNTPGGSISAGWSILAALNEIDKEADMTVLGDADSFGFIMLLFARKVKAFDTSSFTVHRAASFWEEIMNDEELKVIEDRNSIIREKLEARINEEKFKKVTGKSFDDIFSMQDRLDVTINANQAKEIGLIDEIVTLDSKKKEKYKEIESRYYKDIAALSTKTNINSNKKKMGKSLKELILGQKDPVLLAKVDNKDIVYSKLEVGATVKPTGKGEQEPISGNFEADDKKITVVENEITAVVEIDKKGKEIEALKSELKALKDNQLTAEDVAEVFIENNKTFDVKLNKLEAENKSLKDALAKAKISISKPSLPEGNFEEDKKEVPVTGKKKDRKIQAGVNNKAKLIAEAVEKAKNNRSL